MPKTVCLVSVTPRTSFCFWPYFNLNSIVNYNVWDASAGCSTNPSQFMCSYNAK